jgi:hypothetical protein
MTSEQNKFAPGSIASAGIGLAPQYAALRDLVDQAARDRDRAALTSTPAGVGGMDADPDGDPDAGASLKLPSGWYAADAEPHARWRPRPELRAAVFGLLAGVVVLLPVTLWLNASDASRVMVPRDDLASAASQLVVDARVVRLAEPQSAVERLQVAGLTTADAQEFVDADLDEARRLMLIGDVIAARTLLATAAAATSPRALFLMAETFDPNMLAAWGTRGVTADPDRARALYAAANALGHEKADGRLDALK